MSSRNWFKYAAAATAFAAAGAVAQPYEPISPPQPTEGGGKVEVIEFFWYGCPHCYTLEPAVAAWTKSLPPDVVFKRVPAAIGGWSELAKLFYTLEAMGILDQYHQKVFDAIHKSQVNLGNKKMRDEWFAKNGIDPAKYAEVEKSFSVVTKLKRAEQLSYAYKVDTVPRVAVNGKYTVTADRAGGIDKVFPVVDQLIAQARKEKAS